jgi:hypothetical protein
VLLPATSQAGMFLPEFTGHTQMAETAGFPDSDGIVNFTVYFNDTASDWRLVLGIGSVVEAPDGLDSTARYVFFYQVVNTNPITTEQPLVNFSVDSGGSPYSSVGYLDATVLVDFDGDDVGPSGNRYLGTEGSPHKPDDIVNGIPTESGVPLYSDFTSDLPDAFIANGNAVNPNSFQRDPNGDQFVADFTFSPSLTADRFSSLLFLTSNQAPTYRQGNISSSNTNANGDVPAHVPEPASLAIWGIGLAVVTASSARYRQVAWSNLKDPCRTISSKSTKLRAGENTANHWCS